MVNPCYFIASLKKSEDNSFSVTPITGFNKNKSKENENGVYASFYNKEIFAVYDKNVSRMALKPEAKKEKISEDDILMQIQKYGAVTGFETDKWMKEKKVKYFTAVLCCFHPDYVKVDSSLNDLEILLEGKHEIKQDSFIVNTRSSVKFAPAKTGPLDAWV